MGKMLFSPNIIDRIPAILSSTKVKKTIPG